MLLCVATAGCCTTCAYADGANATGGAESSGGTAAGDMAAGGAGRDGTGQDDAAAPSSSEQDTNGQEQTMTTITITIDGTGYDATLAATPAARAFAGMLPLTLRMDELNGNEKYHYLDESLPSEPQSVGSIEAGDLMLYGSDCVVLFYRSFRTPYSYTRLGRIDDPQGLAAALGSGSAEVTFAAR